MRERRERGGSAERKKEAEGRKPNGNRGLQREGEDTAKAHLGGGGQNIRDSIEV